MKNKKGFTLIELLAVIVILAIIALIATPIVLNMINNARKRAAESSALGFVDAIEYNNGFAQTEQAGYTEINGTDLDATSINVKMKGKKPTGGTVTIENGKVTSANICVEEYTVVYDGREVTKVDKGCNGSSSSESSITTCPGCKFIFTTSTLTIGESAPTGTVDDYTILINTHPYFLGLITDDKNVIQRVFACGIINESAFCLEGNDPTKYEKNVKTLNETFHDCKADASNSPSYCLESDILGYASSDGSVTVVDIYNSNNGNSYCGVAPENYDSFKCEKKKRKCIGHDIDGNPCPAD